MTELNSFNLDQPVPGQSLTTEPEARPWENPAEFTDSVFGKTAEMQRAYKPKKISFTEKLL